MIRFWTYAVILCLFCVSLTVTAAHGVRRPCLPCLDGTATATTAVFPSSLQTLPSWPPTVTIIAQARGKKKKRKTTSAVLMIGASVVAASVVLFAILNAITAALVKAFVFTFVAKFLVSANWIPSGNSSKRHAHRKGNVMILME